MALVHPLDCTVWSALTGRQSHLALVHGNARRYDPAYGVFAAASANTPSDIAGLGVLVAAHGDVALLEAEPPAAAPGIAVVSQDPGVQMIAERVASGPPTSFEMVALTDADGPQMLALATLTRPGPFFERTHQLGDFFGVKVEGELVAMAGERMKPDGFTEVSGVCTDPEHRGRGYASALMRLVASRILDRGEAPFLHAYASNQSAIALYETLGFRLRRKVLMTRLTGA
jgi:predicted GNAT family acetyltransferase